LLKNVTIASYLVTVQTVDEEIVQDYILVMYIGVNKISFQSRLDSFSLILII
jgi:hypothetical protein